MKVMTKRYVYTSFIFIVLQYYKQSSSQLKVLGVVKLKTNDWIDEFWTSRHNVLEG